MILLTMSERLKTAPNKFSFYQIIAGVVLVLFEGLRSSNVGTDTNNYVGIFNGLKYNTHAFKNSDSTIESGYMFLQNIAFAISSEYWSLLTVIAIVGVFISLKSFQLLSLNFKISVFLFITLASYLFLFNGARQGLAACVYGIAFFYLVNKKLWHYVLWVFIATLFHKTALIMLPFFYILHWKLSVKKMLLFVLVSLIALLYLSTFLSLFEDNVQERYAVYETRGAQGGFSLGLFFIVLSFYLVYLRKKITLINQYRYNIYLNTCVFSSLIYFVVIATGRDVNFIRLSLYFMIGYFLIWPIIFKDVKFFQSSFGKIIFYTIHLLFFAVYLSKMSNLTPYQFNFNLFY